MSHLFSVKNFSLFSALQSTGTLARLCRGGGAQTPNDGLHRFVLRSPEVQAAVRRSTGLPDFRIRIAYPEDPIAAGFMAAANTLRLEVYTVEGKPVGEPQLLPNLDDDLAVAIEAELFHELLKSKGIDIPLL